MTVAFGVADVKRAKKTAQLQTKNVTGSGLRMANLNLPGPC